MTSNQEIHKRIRNAITEIEVGNRYICTNVELIAKKAKVDIRTARNHLEVLEEYKLGKFCDPKKKTFSTATNIIKSMKGCGCDEK